MNKRRTRRRIYDAMLEAHLDKYRQIVFVSGPRQVVIDAGCLVADCFAKQGKPLIVPAQTFRTQLL